MTRPRRRRPTVHRPAAAAEPLESRAYFATGLTFGAVTSYPVTSKATDTGAAAGTNPAAIATADFNGDGHPDVVTADFGNNDGTVINGGISVLMGTADHSGTFGDATFYATGVPMQSVAVADLNGDGHPDIVAVGSSANYVYVWLNNGDGTFPTNATAYAVGAQPEGVAIADVDGDGHPDIITANQGAAGNGSISVLHNNGDGTFDIPHNGASDAVPFDGGPNPDALAVGDLNQDGYPDIVTVDPENDEVHVLLNKGTKATTTTITNPDGTTSVLYTGQFATTNTAYETDTTGRAVAIVDVNNDGLPDLAVANLRSASVGTFLNNGDGTFQAETTFRVGGFPFSVTSADLNNDNRAELITADSRDNAVGVLVHNAQGGFNSGGGTGKKNDGTDQPRQFLTGISPEGVAVADVNGDGKPDLITADFNGDGTGDHGSIGVLLNNTAFTPALIPTALTLTVSQNPVELRNPLTLTATISPAPSTAYPAGRVVQFVSGTKVLGVAKLAADGTATITTTKLPATGLVTARYSGNGHYTGSVASVEETVLSAGDENNTPLVAPTAVAITSRAGRAGRTTTAPPAPLPVASRVTTTQTASLVAPTGVVLTSAAGQPTSPFVPGDRGSVAVIIDNFGDNTANGSVNVALSMVPFANAPGDLTGAVALAPVTPATFAVSLVGGGGFVVPISFTVPTALAAGNYKVVATLTTGGPALTDAQVSPAPVASVTPIPVTMVLVPFVPGDAGTAAVTIANQGPGRASGEVAVSLSIAPVGDLSAAVPVATVGNATFALNLVGGTSSAVTVAFTVPASLTAGDYTLLASLAPVRTFSADQVSTATVAAANATTVITAFGKVPSGKTRPTLTTTLPDGSVVTLSLAGPGSATLSETPVTATDGTVADRVDLTATNTTDATTITVTSVHGTPVTMNTIIDNFRLGALVAPDLTLAGNAAIGVTGALSLATGVDRVTLAGMNDAGIGIGPRGHAALSLGTVANTALSSAAALQSLTVTSWTDTLGRTINAPGILGAVTSAGDFGATMILSGAGLKVSLGSASIGGTLSSATWLLGTSAGAIHVGDDLNNVEILAGATFVVDKAHPAGHYVFNAARIAAVTIVGNVTGSFVAAGYRPTSDVNPPFDPTGGTTLPGGSIGAITVGGTIDATSRFAAASLPTIG